VHQGRAGAPARSALAPVGLAADSCAGELREALDTGERGTTW
jgi:hypothetical protein